MQPNPLPKSELRVGLTLIQKKIFMSQIKLFSLQRKMTD